METQQSVTVTQKNIRISPYKMRRVADAIRGKRTVDAEAVLSVLPHNGALILKKLVRSAVANVSHNLGVTNTDLLTVREIFVNEGRVGKRFQPKGRGRIYQILKRSCHVVLTVSNARGK